MPKESLLRQHEHDRQKESIMIHASLNIHEPKWNVNQFQGQTESYIPRADRIIQFMDGGTLSFGIPWNKGYAVSRRINRYQDMKLR